MVLASCAGVALAQAPMGTAFTYQGQLKQAGVPLDGTADFEFSLWRDATSTAPAAQIDVTIGRDDVLVVGGQFTVWLDFGPDAFDGNARWLEVTVRVPHDPTDLAPYSTLGPRHELTPTPYALQTRGLFVDNAGNVGIGTPYPTAKLYVVDSPAPAGATTLAIDNTVGNPDDASRLSFRHDGSEQAYIETHLRLGWPTDLVFATGSARDTGLTEKMRITSDGNVGIGTSAVESSAALTVESNIACRGTVRCTGADADVTVVNPANPSASVGLNWYGNVARIRVGGTGPGSQTGLDIQGPGNETLLRIVDNAGGIGSKVGIGVADPQYPLHVNGDVRAYHVLANLVTIMGADVAEKFPVRDKVKPGMVVAIDADNPGELCLARGAYNRCVAGIVSGAGGLAAGAVLGHLPGAEDAPAIALTGRVWCYCDADTGGPIAPGDLLTTSDTPGHAMKVTDYARGQGAIIGKAMSKLASGKGLVLVLVSLQ